MAQRCIRILATGGTIVAARALNPQKSRILLQLALTAGLAEPAAIQAEFDAPRHVAR